MNRTLFVPACAFVLATACASPNPGNDRVLPADLAPQVDGAKNDSLSNYYTDIVGSLTYESSAKGSTSGFVGYTFQASAGDQAGFDIVSTDWTLTWIYGPRRDNGRWGKPVVKSTTDFIDWGHDAGAITFEVPEDGEYMIVLGPIFSGAVDYEVALGCGGGPCDAPAPTCQVGGCSGQLCVGPDAPAFSTCDYQPWYACYKLSQCGNFGEGEACGWQESPEFVQCMADNGAPGYGSTLGKTCGGFAGQTCDKGQFCDYQPGASCGWADAAGTCEAIPTACIELYQPVCGCDGQTYSNSCFAAAAATGVLHEGACESTCTGTVAAEGVDVTGGWTATGDWEVQYTFRKDGTFTKTDLVSPCPEGVVCFWSGIVTNEGTWTVEGSALWLTFTTQDTTGGVTLPPSMKIREACDGSNELHDGTLEFTRL